MSIASSINSTFIQQWIAQKLDEQKVRESLAAAGHDEDSISAHLKAYLKAKSAKRQSLGFIYLLVGAFLGFVSCVLTLINPIPTMSGIFLYGLTTVAICVIFAGLYYVLE